MWLFRSSRAKAIWAVLAAVVIWFGSSYPQWLASVQGLADDPDTPRYIKWEYAAARWVSSVTPEALAPIVPWLLIGLAGLFIAILAVSAFAQGQLSMSRRDEAPRNDSVALFYSETDPNCYQSGGFVDRVVVGGNVPSDETIYRVGVRSSVALDGCRIVLVGSEPRPHDPGRHRLGLAMRPRIPVMAGSAEFRVHPGTPSYVDVLQEVSPQSNPMHEASVIRLTYSNDQQGKSNWFENGDYVETFRLSGPTIEPVDFRLAVEFDGRRQQRRWRVRTAEVGIVRSAGLPDGLAALDVRFSQLEPYRHAKRVPIVRYRVGVYNSGSTAAKNVEVVLRDVQPRPRTNAFRADFPYLATPTTGDERVRARDINAGREELFEILAFWWNSDRSMFVVSRLDTKCERENDGAITMEDGESWLLDYLVTGANVQHQVVAFRATREGDIVHLQRQT